MRGVCLGEKQLCGELRLVPVDKVAAQQSFLAAFLQTNLRSYQARWTRKVFREGIRPPLVKGSDAEVMSFVRSTPGAIGYLMGEAGTGVTVPGALLDRQRRPATLMPWRACVRCPITDRADRSR